MKAIRIHGNTQKERRKSLGVELQTSFFKYESELAEQAKTGNALAIFKYNLFVANKAKIFEEQQRKFAEQLSGVEAVIK